MSEGFKADRRRVELAVRRARRDHKIVQRIRLAYNESQSEIPPWLDGLDAGVTLRTTVARREYLRVMKDKPPKEEEVPS